MENNSAKARLTLGAVCVGLLVLGSVQGRRLDGIDDAEKFYRWLVLASTNTRLDGSLEYFDSARTKEALDDEFFVDVIAMAESYLPEMPLAETDYDANGEAFSKIVRAAFYEEDDALWRFARSGEAATLRERFVQYRAAGDLQSASRDLTATNLYDQGDDQYTIGVSSLFFGFRKVAANFLWLEVDKYWHQGQMHRMVPMMRSCVTLDPNFVDAYLMGAWHLAYNITAKLEVTPEALKTYHPKYGKRLGLREVWYYAAADFLKGGIRNNPRDYRLYFDLGYAVYDEKLKDWPNSIRYLREATHHRHDRWVPRRLNMSLMFNGEYEEAIAGWERYTAEFPDNVVATRFLKVNRAYLHEALADEAAECAKAARAAAEALRLEIEELGASGAADRVAELEVAMREAEADGSAMHDRMELETVTAQSLWSDLWVTEADPLAEARLLRIEALDLLDEGRALEAVQALMEARWKSASYWEEASALIMGIKQEYDLPLSTSERLAVERERLAAVYRDESDVPEKIRRLDCSYLDEAD